MQTFTERRWHWRFLGLLISDSWLPTWLPSDGGLQYRPLTPNVQACQAVCTLSWKRQRIIPSPAQMLKCGSPGGLCLLSGRDGGGELLGFLVPVGARSTHALPSPKLLFSAEADWQIINAVCKTLPKLQSASLRNIVMENKSNGKWSSYAGQGQKNEQGLESSVCAQLCYWLRWWPWAKPFIFLCPRFAICKWG